VRNRTRLAWTLAWLTLVAWGASAKADSASADSQNAIVITFTDGQQKSFPAADVARLELKPPAAVIFRDGRHQSLNHEIARIEFKSEAAVVGHNHFLGRWKCGDGAGGTFYVTLEKNGVARKSIGSTGGTWKLVDGEAHISWDDGWKDIIRKSGTGHQKIAFGPGKSFSDEPSNVTAAKNENAEPI
jgi:hypothetical protein